VIPIAPAFSLGKSNLDAVNAEIFLTVRASHGSNRASFMDRRQYLGFTGASVVALLGGCSSSDGGGQSGSTATATGTPAATDSATATASETPTESPEPTEEPTETPDGSGADITSEHEQYAEEIGKSPHAAWWIFENYLRSSTDIDDSKVDDAPAGEKGEAAVTQVNPENFAGGTLRRSGVPWIAPDFDRTRNIAEYVSTYLTEQLDETAIALPSSFLHDGMPSNTIYISVDGNFTAAHALNDELKDQTVLNSKEGAAYQSATRKEINNMPDEEVRLGTGLNTEFGPNGGIKSDQAITDSKGVLRGIERGNYEPIQFNDEFSEASLLFNSSESSHRNTPALAMKEGGINVTGYKMQPYEENGKWKVRDLFGFFDIVDQVNEELAQFDQFEDWNMYEEERLPARLGVVVGSNQDNTEYDVSVEWVEDIDYESV
jgi:hypothetical protein